MNRLSRSVVLLVIVSIISVLPAAATPGSDFDTFANRYIASYYAFRPDRATRDGLHEHDRRLGGFTRGEIDSEIVRLRDARTAILDMVTAGLDTARLVDHQILANQVESQLLDLETARRWEKDPGYYLHLATDGIYTLVARPFAPEPERLRSVIEREKMIGAVLSAAVENLRNPPKIWTQAAIEDAAGAVDFFRTTVPAAFAAAGNADPVLKAEFDAVNASTVQQMESFVAYLKEDVLPASNGDFRLGADAFLKKLLYDEMCDVPLYRLERYGEEEMTKLQLQVGTTAAAVDSAKAPRDVFRVLSIDHPDPDGLVAETGRVLDGVRQFCTEKNLVTLPATGRCTVDLMPAFERSGLFTALDAPGPFEPNARDGFFYVTPPPGDWDPLKQDDYMRTYNRYGLPILAIHEAYPGRFVQCQSSANAPTRVRKVFGCSSFERGWGSYCAEMMLDQGYQDNDPRYRLFQLQYELLETCRYLAAIRMHTGTMTYPQAVDFFMKEGYQERINAEREARNVTLDPACLASELGKLQMVKLREDYRRSRGAAFNLRDFHDRVLAAGAPPLKILRRILMPGDKGSVL